MRSFGKPRLLPSSLRYARSEKPKMPHRARWQRIQAAVAFGIIPGHPEGRPVMACGRTTRAPITNSPAKTCGGRLPRWVRRLCAALRRLLRSPRATRGNFNAARLLTCVNARPGPGPPTPCPRPPACTHAHTPRRMNHPRLAKWAAHRRCDRTRSKMAPFASSTAKPGLSGPRTLPRRTKAPRSVNGASGSAPSAPPAARRNVES